jgi:hypothetical protein
MEPPAKKPRTLLLDDSSGSESEGETGGVRLNGAKSTDEPVLKINEEYARRFEYNKKREEKQQCESQLSLYGSYLLVLIPILFSGGQTRQISCSW